MCDVMRGEEEEEQREEEGRRKEGGRDVFKNENPHFEKWWEKTLAEVLVLAFSV